MRHPPSDIYEFRNPIKYGLNTLREIMRRMPGVRMDIEDLDIILRWKPSVTELGIGRVRLVEGKEAFWDRWDKDVDDVLNRSKRVIIREMDLLFQDADWYDGYYVVRYGDDNHDWDTKYKVENTELDAEGFDEWVSNSVSEISSHKFVSVLT